MQTHNEHSHNLHNDSTAQDLTTEPETFSPVKESISISPGKPNPKNLTPGRILSLQRTVGNQAVMRILRERGSLPIARIPDVSASEENSSAEEEAEEPAVQAEQQEAQAEAAEIAPEVGFVKGKPALAEFVTEVMTEDSESENPEVAKPSLWKRIKTASSGVWRSTKGAAVGASQAANSTKISDALQLGTAGTAQAATAAPGIGVAAGGIDMALTGYSLVSSAKKSSKLSSLAAQEAGAGDGNQDLSGALNYAASQKKEKAIKKGVGFAGSAASAAGSVIGLMMLAGMLATNPVGWALLIAGGTVAGGMIAYRVGRMVWKRIKENRGKVRGEMALKLYNGVLAGNTRAIKAVQELGLDLNEVKKANGDMLIKDKLKSF
jgi:hypothetical protein